MADDFDDDWDLPPPKMTPLDYWRICDELSIVQAALLIAGIEPSGFQYSVEKKATRPDGYDAAKVGISNALKRGTLEGNWCKTPKYDDEGIHIIDYEEDSIELHASTVLVDSLTAWLEGRGVVSGFFFPEAKPKTDYLDPEHERYAPKLAAAVSAWNEAGSEELQRGKTPKQALDKWLRENAARFGMTDAEGKPIDNAIEDCSKVANWKPGGGAPKTPSKL